MADPILIAKDNDEIHLLPKMSNRHGLIAGATGTGKSVTLRVMAESFAKLGIPVFMKEDLVPVIGDENMIQEMPEEFNKVLEVQKSWKK